MESYWSAYTVVPLICLAYIFIGMHGMAICGLLIVKKTKFLAYSTVIAVAANIALNFALIPKWGAMGAAVATVCSFWIRFYSAYRYSQKAFPLKYEWRRINIALALAVGIVVFAQVIGLEGMTAHLAADTALLFAFPTILYFAGWFHEREKTIILDVLRNPAGIIKAVKKLREEIS